MWSDILLNKIDSWHFTSGFPGILHWIVNINLDYICWSIPLHGLQNFEARHVLHRFTTFPFFFCLDSRLILDPPGLPRHGGQYEWVCRRHQFLGRAAGPPNRSSIVAWSLRSDLWKGLAHVWSQELASGVMIVMIVMVFLLGVSTVFLASTNGPPRQLGFVGYDWSKIADTASWEFHGSCCVMTCRVLFRWMDRCESLSLFVCTAYLGIFFKIPWFNNSCSSLIDWVYTFILYTYYFVFVISHGVGWWLKNHGLIIPRSPMI